MTHITSQTYRPGTGVVNRGSTVKARPRTFRSILKCALVGALLFSSTGALAAKDLCKQPNMREVCRGNLGIPRARMPQLDEDVLAAYLIHKSTKGTWIEMKEIPAYQLVPTQSELNRNLVFSFLKRVGSWFDFSRSPILVAKNSTGHLTIIDGHHRATASRLSGVEQRSIVIHDDQVLEDLTHFPGVKQLPLNEDLSRWV